MADSKYIPRLKLVYKNEIIPALIKDMNISNVMLVPKIEKIVLCGVDIEYATGFNGKFVKEVDFNLTEGDTESVKFNLAYIDKLCGGDSAKEHRFND